LRRLLWCAERFNESATLCGSPDRKIFGSRFSALLRSLTRADQRLLLRRARLAFFDDRFVCFAILQSSLAVILFPPSLLFARDCDCGLGL